MHQRNIVIIGASSGLGLALARLYCQSGCRVGAAARSGQKLRALAAEFPGQVVTAAIDVDSPQGPDLLEQLIGQLGGMDVYVHVAGIGYDNPRSLPQREADIVNTDCTGFARMVYAAFMHFARGGRGGQVAAVSSVAGTKGIAGMEAYSASKAFDQRYLQALRQRSVTERLGITVTDLRPGWTRTPLLHNGKRYALEMEPDTVVRAMKRAIDRRRNIATINRRWALLCALWRFLPDVLWRHLPTRKFT